MDINNEEPEGHAPINYNIPLGGQNNPMTGQYVIFHSDATHDMVVNSAAAVPPVGILDLANWTGNIPDGPMYRGETTWTILGRLRVAYRQRNINVVVNPIHWEHQGTVYHSIMTGPLDPQPGFLDMMMEIWIANGMGDPIDQVAFYTNAFFHERQQQQQQQQQSQNKSRQQCRARERREQRNQGR